ncbi:hypothetical protein FRB96_000322 [Tulasnella sp. 330]|nr:hypothetical protein FRB96_000322 [Tulasnella sp. 330]KAG8877614.1 hypothetical protein FRB97_003243 [Tulasnella sp. 331]
MAILRPKFRPILTIRATASCPRQTMSRSATTENFGTPSSPPKSPPIRKAKKEGDISSVFTSLSGAAHVELPPRFAELKRTIVGSSEDAQLRLRQSFADLLEAIKIGVAEIRSKGDGIIPEISFAELAGGRVSDAWKAEVKRRGTIVVRDVVNDEEALGWKEDIKAYVKSNPQVKGFPSDNKQVFELYWSKSQLAARGHPNVLAVQKALQQQLFHTEPSVPISLNITLSYADRLRIRHPGDSKFALGPHIDGGSLERWEDEAYRRCYEEILQGRWRDHDAWDVGRRVNVNSDLYHGASQCSVFRAFQSWLSMSATGPGEGTLRVFPLLKEASAYVILRPFFRPSVSASSPDFLSASSWKLDLTSTDFPNSVMGMGQELNDATHPHLRLEEGGMVSMKLVNPGDMVFWHCDAIHAVEKTHSGKGDSSVLYIPVVPLTTRNAEYLAYQRATLLEGIPAPDFPGGAGEAGFVGVGGPKDIVTEEARMAMGLSPHAEWPDPAAQIAIFRHVTYSQLQQPLRAYTPLKVDTLGSMAGSRSRPLDEEEPSQYRPLKLLKLEHGSVSVDSESGSTASTTPDLRSLLDLSDVIQMDIPLRVQRISEVLVHHSRLELKSDGVTTRYQVLEAEFYLKDPGRHWDPFAHGEEEQGVAGRWYFHRAPRRTHSLATDAPLPRKPPSGYRGGTRKGLDLTCGGPFMDKTAKDDKAIQHDQHPVTGGILLRTLRRESDDKVISGPSLLVDEIIARSGASGLKDLVDAMWAGDSEAFACSSADASRSTSLFVVPFTPKPDVALPQLFTSPRIGLDLSNPHDAAARLEMVDRPYRFFIQPRLLTANGRGHTFLGVFQAKKKMSKHSGARLVAEIARTTGLSESAAGRYMQFYLAGRETHIQAYVGEKGKGVSGSPEKLLKMMGALEKRRMDTEEVKK